MFGFKSSKEAEDYDTGCWFYEAIQPFKKKSISYRTYVLHFRAGSWLEDAETKHRYKTIPPERWLNSNKMYWEDRRNTDEKNESQVKYVPKEMPETKNRPKPLKRPVKPPVRVSGLTSTGNGRKVALIRR